MRIVLLSIWMIVVMKGKDYNIGVVKIIYEKRVVFNSSRFFLEVII